MKTYLKRELNSELMMLSGCISGVIISSWYMFVTNLLSESYAPTFLQAWTAIGAFVFTLAVSGALIGWILGYLIFPHRYLEGKKK